MVIQVGKISPINDADPRLSAIWKRNLGSILVDDPFTYVQGRPGPGSGDDGGEENPDRPQLADIVFKGFETYTDSFGMQKQKAKFRIYNSSKEPIDGFKGELTQPDSQGGRS